MKKHSNKNKSQVNKLKNIDDLQKQQHNDGYFHRMHVLQSTDPLIKHYNSLISKIHKNKLKNLEKNINKTKEDLINNILKLEAQQDTEYYITLFLTREYIKKISLTKKQHYETGTLATQLIKYKEQSSTNILRLKPKTIKSYKQSEEYKIVQDKINALLTTNTSMLKEFLNKINEYTSIQKLFTYLCKKIKQIPPLEPIKNEVDAIFYYENNDDNLSFEELLNKEKLLKQKEELLLQKNTEIVNKLIIYTVPRNDNDHIDDTDNLSIDFENQDALTE